jgi:hypothetical protein
MLSWLALEQRTNISLLTELAEFSVQSAVYKHSVPDGTTITSRAPMLCCSREAHVAGCPSVIMRNES